MTPATSRLSDPPSWLVDWSQIGGAIFGLLAFVIAIVAILQTKRTAIKERRRQHELEVLRRLAELFEVRHFADRDTELDTKAKIAAQLMLLKTEDLPTVRAAISAGVSQSDLDKFKSTMQAWLESGSGRSYLADVAKEFPQHSTHQLAVMASSFDKPRWIYVTQHEQIDESWHIYGYTSNSLAYRELMEAISRRLDEPQRTLSKDESSGQTKSPSARRARWRRTPR